MYVNLFVRPILCSLREMFTEEVVHSRGLLLYIYYMYLKTFVILKIILLSFSLPKSSLKGLNNQCKKISRL